MVCFPIHSIESAPERSKPALEQLQQAFGFVPNLVGAIANSPVLTNSLVGLFQNVHGGSFTEAEIQALLLTNAVTNACAWAVAFHTALALKEGIDPADVQAIRVRQLPANKRYAALSTLARTLIEQRGCLSNEDLTAFIEAGFEQELALEFVAVVAASTITNYAGNITKPPLEAPFQEHAWRG
jgi:AhpD family alkylhydroperoxidase